ncbi:phosphopantetheine-binding protein [Paenibacillus sp. FSL R7-0048]|uniref:acyl carrier protein n=1 Tax=Paenibacillus TaxID=44249 RepID=UPI00096C5CB5|nr:acyl carrier protein [Paenibacillus odorifer]OMD67402.1 D-alanyl carrier protein [Paenibacillus odorifer]OMD78626.1 D-alanyl carrier protein [Paenibacillus odorifer]
MDEVQLRIEHFLLRMFRVNTIGLHDDIFALGSINSLFAMQLILFLEKEFKIRIENQDMDLNQFKTLASITELVERKRLMLRSSGE